MKMPFSAPGYSSADAENWLAGLDSSQNHFFGEAMDGPFTREDLTRLGPRFDVPIFIFQGTEDDIAPASLAEAFARSPRAPHVEYVPVSHAGALRVHDPVRPASQAVAPECPTARDEVRLEPRRVVVMTDMLERKAGLFGNQRARAIKN